MRKGPRGTALAPWGPITSGQASATARLAGRHVAGVARVAPANCAASWQQGPGAGSRHQGQATVWPASGLTKHTSHSLTPREPTTGLMPRPGCQQDISPPVPASSGPSLPKEGLPQGPWGPGRSPAGTQGREEGSGGAQSRQPMEEAAWARCCHVTLSPDALIQKTFFSFLCCQNLLDPCIGQQNSRISSTRTKTMSSLGWVPSRHLSRRQMTEQKGFPSWSWEDPS